MNKGFLILEASILIPLVILIFVLFLSIILYFVIDIDTQIDLYIAFMQDEKEEGSLKYKIRLPLLDEKEALFEESRREVDLGRCIQDSKILSDIFE